MNWYTCPSVTEGGKDYFYVSLKGLDKTTVAWDRVEEQWELSFNDNHVAYFKTIRLAKKQAETLA